MDSRTKVISPSDEVLAARAQWTNTGKVRPPFAQAPRAGQDSVWDYPRPPLIEPVTLPLRVMDGAKMIAETTAGHRVLETASAPTYYFPAYDVDFDLVKAGDTQYLCEWKGLSRVISVGSIKEAGWLMTDVYEEFAELAGWVSFYPRDLACFIGDEQARPQPGGYYGGWVTTNLAGPIKGAPGSGGW